ncbi:unnamed protein product [Oncorhynchus mykiss]|uniref:Uncharacterized protein n=1 Tax=Oncorhynchus mykiss TaxID=8022 RepID=A0A060ZNU0_ONCMY|nr:unnamed protein product [Oncorhynchus mykiss]
METISFYLSDNQLPPGYLHKARTLTDTFIPSGASDTTLAALATASSLWIQTSHQILEQHYREEISHKYTILYNTPSFPDWQEAWYLGVTWAQKLLSEPLRDYLLQDIRDSLPKFYGNWPTRDNSPFQPPLTHCQPHSEDEGDTTLPRAHTSRPSPPPRTHGHPTPGRYPLKEDSTSPLPESSNTTTPETNISPIQQRTTRTLEAERQLQNTAFYQLIERPIYLRSTALIKRELLQMERKNLITKRQRDYLTGDTPTRRRCFYLLPKIHKDPSTWPLPFETPPGRPIISDCGSETYGISQRLDIHLRPLASKHNSHL